MKKKIFIAAAVLIGSHLYAQKSVPANSGDSTKNLDEVVITATKFPIKQSLTGKVVTVIDQQQLQRNSGKSLTEVLNTQAGIIVNGSSNVLGTNQDVYMRGAAAGKTLILLDGVPVYDASGISGAFDLNLITVDQVERIEILKGSQSTLYGSDAIAGVINIISKKGGAKKINATANLAGGSYNTFKGSVGLNGTVKNTAYHIQYSKLYSKGFSTAQNQTGVNNFDKDGMDRNAFRANISRKINDKFSVKANTQFSNYKTDADAGQFKDDADYTIKNRNTVMGIGADYTLGKSILHFNYNYNKVNRIYLDDSASRGGFSYYSKGDYTGKSHFAELYSNIAVTKHVDVLVGADYRNQLTNQNYFSVSSFGPYASTPLSDDSTKVNQFGAYASVVVKDLKGFNVELGGRYNNFNKYGNVFTFSFNPSYVIKRSVKIFGNISSGFKAPSLYQVYSEYRNPAQALRPEKSLSIEGGIQYYKDNVNIRAVYFSRNISDNIAFFSAGAPTYANYYVNADIQKDKGLELEASIDFGRVTVNANYVNLDGRIETKTGAKDTTFFNLYRRPRQTINLNVGIELCKNWNMNMGVQSISKRYEAVYASAPIEMPAYYVWNLYSTYSITTNIKAFVDLKNITDEQYSEVYGYNNRRFNFMAGVNLNF
ncbi:MAG: TonB-dependent receptor [Chitinophagaceae bacterium]|nr:TonB-dependent receptor [Chitinophagaceae bacterium]